MANKRQVDYLNNESPVLHDAGLGGKRRKRQFDPERLKTLAYFDADAAKRYAPIAPRTFYQAIADGKLPAFRIGGTGKLVVRREDLDRFIAASPVGGDIHASAGENSDSDL